MDRDFMSQNLPSVDASVAVTVAADLGENPLWSVGEQMIYWHDCTGRRFWRHDPLKGVTEEFKLAGMPGSFCFRRDGGLLYAFRNRLALYDVETGAETPIEVPVDFSRERFNDGKCDRRGRFFVGTMDPRTSNPVGGLYRVDTDRTCTRLTDGITLSNGIAFSPDDRILYHCESRPGYVYAHDYDIETGEVENRRVFVDTSATGIHPDGCTIDAEGCLWTALPGSGQVVRFDPDGKQMSAVRVPTSRVTSLSIGGPDLDTFFITSMRYNLTEAQLAEQPEAGFLFQARPGVRGLPEPCYHG